MRPRRKTGELPAASDAVREVRAALGMTQQAFANHMQVALTTIARYETGRAPTGVILRKLAEVAEQNGRPDLGNIFRRHLMLQLGSALGRRFREDLELYRRSYSETDITRVEEIRAELAGMMERLEPALSGDAAAAAAGIRDRLNELAAILNRGEKPSVDAASTQSEDQVK